jgi:hypothetical protein
VGLPAPALSWSTVDGPQGARGLSLVPAAVDVPTRGIELTGGEGVQGRRTLHVQWEEC